MKLTEYIAMRAYEEIMSDGGLPEEFGFDNYTQLCRHIIDNQVDVLDLVKPDGEGVWLCSDYEGAYLPVLLAEKMEYIGYLINGLREHNVDL